MTEEQINQSIAKAVGKEYHKPTEDEIKSGSYYQYEPNYARSLDAMHEAEKALTFDQWNTYANHLIDDDRSDENPAAQGYEVIHATAAQRAKAFLQTLNLWDDTK